MAVELVVPEVGESITEVLIAKWLKQPGEWVSQEEPLVEIETDKVTFQLPSPTAGVLREVRLGDGSPAAVGDVIGVVDDSAGAPAEAPAAPAAAPAAGPAPAAPIVMPAAQRLLAEQGLTPADVTPSGPGGRVLKEDVQRRVQAPPPSPAPPAPPTEGQEADDELVPMTPMRRRIAERLVQAQQTAALLTTFNEVDLSGVMALRKEYQDVFQQRHGIKLGFMSFFVKAVVDALKRCPELNAEIRGTDIVYHRSYDIGIAVSGKKGLAVPVIRHAERLSFAEIEAKIADFGARARDNKLELAELQGGTFSITNGGVFGSLLSTPILNPPQSGILGMHAINDRPVAVGGQVVIRPMMYVALTYDHRIVDGREAVTFLRRIKECVENPARMLLEA